MTAAETGRATSKAHLEQLGRDGCGLLCVTGRGLAARGDMPEHFCKVSDMEKTEARPNRARSRGTAVRTYVQRLLLAWKRS